MQNITFIDVTFKNLRCHTEGYLDFSDNKLTAIIGPNGAGKSTHLMAIMACLYGETAEGISMVDLVNRKVGKDLEIVLSIDIDGVMYTFSRYYKHSQHGNSLVVLRDGDDISRKTVTETLKMISDLILPKNVFLNTIYFSQQVKDFFTSLNDKDQKNILNSILQIDEYKKFYDKISSEIKDVSVKIAGFQSQHSEQLSRLENQKSIIGILTDSKTEFDKSLKEKLNTLNLSIVALKHSISELESQITEFKQDDYDSLIEKRDVIQRELAKIESLHDELKSNLDIKKQTLRELLQNEAKGILFKKREDLLADTDASLKEFDIELDKLSTQRVEEEEKYKRQIQAVHDKFSMDIKVVDIRKKDLEKLDKESNDEMMSSMSFDSLLNSAIHENKTIKTDFDNKLQLLEIKKSELDKNSKDALTRIDDINSGICPTCKQSTSSLDSIKEELEKTKSYVEQLQLDHVKCDKDIDELKTQQNIRLNDSDAHIKEMQTKVENSKTKSASLRSECDKLQKEISEEIKKLEIERDSEINDIRDSERQVLDKIDSSIYEIKTKVSESKKSVDITFEKIKTDLMQTYSVKMKNEVDKLQADCDDKIVEYVNKLNELNQELRDIVNSIGSLTKIKEQTIRLKSDCDSKKSRLNELVIEFETESKRSFDMTKLIEAEHSLQEIEVNVSQSEAVLKSAERRHDILLFWKEAFSDRGIPSMLLDGAIPMMNETMATELEKIAPGKFLVTFDTISATKAGDLREKFNVNVLNLENGADNHKLLSGGEKRQIDVCCMKSLRTLMENLYQKHFNITLMDEVLDSLDDENALNFCKHLKVVSRDQCNLLVTHSTAQNSECDEVIRV